MRLAYLIDYLKWLPTYSPLLKTRKYGLDYHAVTIIDIEGAEKALQLFLSLINILKLSPSVLKLTGAYSFVYAYDDVIEPNENVDRILRDTAGYKKIILERNQIVRQFEILVDLLQKVIDSEGNLYILHFGI